MSASTALGRMSRTLTAVAELSAEAAMLQRTGQEPLTEMLSQFLAGQYVVVLAGERRPAVGYGDVAGLVSRCNGVVAG